MKSVLRKQLRVESMQVKFKVSGNKLVLMHLEVKMNILNGNNKNGKEMHNMDHNKIKVELVILLLHSMKNLHNFNNKYNND